ncbi:MAG TPA: rod shape-determining protein RodA, partial [Nevskiaceae bacterium]|nr:rod shape-determining protein RodA [Nevskiaceae bacterium]
MTVAAFLHICRLPPRIITIVTALLLVGLPTVLVVMQPDLGTALLIVTAGVFALFFAGLQWRWILGALAAVAAVAPAVWTKMHDYQRKRVLTFLDPESDPLGAGYHITQSKIAIGSGGLFGKGWLNGTQAKLEFLPEAHTDFIFAVYSEELGLLGILLLLTLYMAIVGRCLWIALRAQDTFQRLLASSLAMTFFIYVFINMGMVIGLMPVVGVPLPLVSYGGTSAVTLLASFGMLMSIQTHRKLLAN